MRHITKNRFFIALLLSIVLTIIIRLFDAPIIQFIAGLRTDALDYLFMGVAFASNIMIIFLFLTILFLSKKSKRRWVFPLWLAGFFSIAVSFLLKVWVKRPRPFQQGLIPVLGIALEFMKDNFNTWNFSFPSFQAMLVFSVLPLLNKEFKRFRHVWLIFACLVAFSRSYFGVHYLSDIMSGAIIGYLIGVIMIKIEERYLFGKNSMKKLKIVE